MCTACTKSQFDWQKKPPHHSWFRSHLHFQCVMIYCVTDDSWITKRLRITLRNRLKPFVKSSFFVADSHWRRHKRSKFNTFHTFYTIFLFVAHHLHFSRFDFFPIAIFFCSIRIVRVDQNNILHLEQNHEWLVCKHFTVCEKEKENCFFRKLFLHTFQLSVEHLQRRERLKQ